MKYNGKHIQYFKILTNLLVFCVTGTWTINVHTSLKDMLNRGWFGKPVKHSITEILNENIRLRLVMKKLKLKNYICLKNM